ncbi:MAG: HEAT repeat domain-containing protein [Gammaproteobacteria bacterium]|nr:HEAT repeat domain-containing protein [Gammaproteobacteria bacterium]MDH5214575.1 HEAT repeat domain-containing protein [Gammaproteobacteria bacterium]MDH5500662.1 HEAT repeat domain-containing protein [Gammaproteobacteria bacterium]
MSLLAGFRADQLLSQLMSQTDTSSKSAQKLTERLKKLGPKVIPNVIEALAMSDKSHTMLFVDILASQVSDKTLDYYKEGLADGGERVVAGTAWALSSSHNYNANALLEFFDDKEVSKPALIEVLKVHKRDLSVHELLRRAYELEPKEKAALFAIIDDVLTEEMVPDLIARMGGKDPAIKIHLIRLLSKFKAREIGHAFEMQLSDPNKMVRSAALTALSTRGNAVRIEKVAKLLHDPDLDVQNKAVDVIVQINHPETIKYLVEALKDESEYTRRSAVEVLNEIGDTNSVKDLLAAIKDDDWWVRARAGDALAEIGGPKVIGSVLELIKDKDEDIRRTAIEILNATKDESAVDTLIRATDDSDWWVRERAVDALAQIGSKKAVPKLVAMLGTNAKTDAIVVRALGKIGDADIISKIVPMLQRPERDLQVEAIRAISHLADEKRAETVRNVLRKIKETDDKTIINSADKAIKEIDAKFSATVLAENVRAEKMAEPTKTLLLDDEDLEKLLDAQARSHVQPLDETQGATAPSAPAMEQKVLDISKLNPGDVIEGRYKYIEKIGKGAFGTVLLMQDQIVDERLILKFLNPNVSSDEEMMKRFVHELRYSRMITHKNVIRIYDFLYLQGSYAISMEYFPSHTLSGEIPDGKPMSFEKALRFSNDIATGMSIAHQAGVIHRDLKPANILVNDEGLLKIVDFGVAAAASSGDTQLTKTGYVIGSPKYMAPEQILGKKVDETADIYSVGVIMYEMVTGVPPYSRGDHMSVMYQHVQGKAKACQELNPKIPDAYAAVIAKSMSVDKTKRFKSMDELSDALNAITL